MASSSGRRFLRPLWFLLIGPVVGAAVGVGIFVTSWNYRPRYTATIPFRVLPPTAPIGMAGVAAYPKGTDDAAYVIRNQQLLFQEDPFLIEIMKDDAFMKDNNRPDDRNARSAWMMEYGADPDQLKKDLVIVPFKDSPMFDLKMTASDPFEAYILVKAAAKVYLQFLKEEYHAEVDTRNTVLTKALAKEEEQFKIQSDAVQVWASAKSIDVQRSKFDIERVALTNLNADYVKYKSQAQASEAYYKSLIAQREAAEKDGTDVKLAPETAQQLDKDPTVLSLTTLRLSLEQDKAAELSKNSVDAQRLKELDARIDKIGEQVASIQKDLNKTAARRMEETAKNRMVGDQTMALQIEGMKLNKENMVRTLGQDLMTYDQKLDDLKERQALVNSLRAQYNLAEVNRLNEDLRVSQMLPDPAIPRQRDGPDWRWYFPTGAAGGLLVGCFLAAAVAGKRTSGSTTAG